MKQGDILVSLWGYDQTNADFYKVVKATEKSVTLQQVESKQALDYPTAMAGRATPTNVPVGKPFRRKIHRYDNEIYVKISSFEYAYPWDGKPERFTEYA